MKRGASASGIGRVSVPSARRRAIRETSGGFRTLEPASRAPPRGLTPPRRFPYRGAPPSGGTPFFRCPLRSRCEQDSGGLKRVVDYNVRIQVKPDGSGVVTDGVKLSTIPSTKSRSKRPCACATRASPPRSSSPPSARPTRRRTCATAWPWAPTARIHVADRRRDPAAARGARPAQADREGTAGPRDPRQAGHRRRHQPDRPDARDAVGPPAGDLRLEARDRRRQGAR